VKLQLIMFFFFKLLLPNTNVLFKTLRIITVGQFHCKIHIKLIYLQYSCTEIKSIIKLK